jgi:hypothetical protein
MRRHPNRLSPKHPVCQEFGRANHGNAIDNRPKRGPKNRMPLWYTLKYTIEPGVGVVMHSLPEILVL